MVLSVLWLMLLYCLWIARCDCQIYVVYCCRCCTQYDGHTVLWNARSDSAVVEYVSATECCDVWSADADAGHSTADDDEISVSDALRHSAAAAGRTHCDGLAHRWTWSVLVSILVSSRTKNRSHVLTRLRLW